jgi:DNA (cytosine-5)-methyltransferase 1
MAGWGGKGKAWAADVSMWPRRAVYTHLLELVEPSVATPLSARGTAGFLSRTERSTLRFDPEFLVALKEHLKAVTAL